MNNNINLYIGKSGKYSPKMSEMRRMELKNLASKSGKGLVKKLNNNLNSTQIWQGIRNDYAKLMAETRLNDV